MDTFANLLYDLQQIPVANPNATVRAGVHIPAGPVNMDNIAAALLYNAEHPYDRRTLPKQNPPPPTAEQAAKEELWKVMALYKDAILPLRAAFGRFCSYCEQQVTDAIPVEHVVPKAPYPATTLSWDNFLLCCNQCNITKGNRPSRADINSVMPPNANEIDRYAAIRGAYLWPDDGPHTVNNVYAYRGLPANLYFENWTPPPAWLPLNPTLAVADDMTLVSAGDDLNKNFQVRVTVPNIGPWVFRVRAQLDPIGPGAAAAQLTVNQMSLDEDGAGKNGDNRMWDRTDRWVSAVRHFAALQANFSEGHFDTIVDLATKGFMSTWVRVLELRGGSFVAYPPQPTVSLMVAFLFKITQQPTGKYFGTDFNYIP